MNRPTTRKQLWGFIAVHFGIALPWRTFSAGHSSPFEFVADGFFRPGAELAAWANRRGGKTLAASILAALEYRFADEPLKGRVLSGSEDQAKVLYAYWRQWCDALLSDRVTASPGRLITRLDNGDFEILAASPKRVRGPGIQRLYWDEVDEIAQEIMDASVGTLTTLGQTPARIVATSTWHHAHGPMSELVNSREAKGFTLHKWNIWESIRRCEPDRHQHGAGCDGCRLAKPCMAKARELDRRTTVGVAAQASGLFAIDDAIKQLSQWSAQQWDAEAECRRPALDGLVYPQFDPSVHIVDGLDFDPDLPTCRAIDWGLNDFVCLWIQHDKAGRVYVVDEFCSQQATVAANAADIAALDAGVAIEASYCDPAGRNRNDQTGCSDIEVFRARGLPCTYTLAPWARQVRNGINLIRAALAPALGEPRLRISGNCKQLIRALESYRLRRVNGQYIDEPIKPQRFDHQVDALRYYYVNSQGHWRAEAKEMGYA